MQIIDGFLRLSATDLVGYLNCKALTELDRAVAAGDQKRPFRHDPMLEVLRERGARHEAAYVAHVEARGLAITTIPGFGVDDAAVDATLAAMRAGVPVIVQAALRDGQWIGRADVLHRVEIPSDLGPWSYEPLDTKLATETKAGTVLQLCLYAELLRATQGVVPEHAYVVAPWTDFVPHTYRVADYAAYFRRVKAGLEAAVLEATAAAMHTSGDQLIAWLGPAIGQSAFEVGGEVRDAFVSQHAEAVGAFVPSANAGRFMADIYQLARIRLHKCGIAEVYGGGFCTVSDARFYSTAALL